MFTRLGPTYKGKIGFEVDLIMWESRDVLMHRSAGLDCPVNRHLSASNPVPLHLRLYQDGHKRALIRRIELRCMLVYSAT